MSVALQESETLQNLMRAFAGESQARNRYDFAAGLCRTQKLYVLSDVFRFTAGQEREHAEIFYRHMAPLAGQKVPIQADYPVDLSNDVSELLRRARDDEYSEANDLYPAFAGTARREGFPEIAASFEQIARIEQAHGNRFGTLLDWLTGGTLFTGGGPWMCLNCGHIVDAPDAPQTCPVCSHEQGYFIRLDLAPYGGKGVVV